jgi:hypothetical protein
MLAWVRSSGLVGQFAIGAACLAGYVVLEWISFIHEYKSVPITPWNPGLGLVGQAPADEPATLAPASSRFSG